MNNNFVVLDLLTMASHIQQSFSLGRLRLTFVIISLFNYSLVYLCTTQDESCKVVAQLLRLLSQGLASLLSDGERLPQVICVLLQVEWISLVVQWLI